MGKRLFIAVDIDEATREQVDRISSGVRARMAIGRMKASWVRPDRMHLTLQFFGDADAALEQRMRDALAEHITEAPFDVSFEGLGIFPERGSPRVLWLGLRDGVEALRRIQRQSRPVRQAAYLGTKRAALHAASHARPVQRSRSRARNSPK